MDTAFKYLKHFDRLLTSYNEGQQENSENNNLVTVGVPRSGKGQVTGWLKEHGLAGEDIKLFETHLTKESHLAEIFQFLFPNGALLNRKAMRLLDSKSQPRGLIQLLKQDRYSDPDTTVSDLKEVLKLCDRGEPSERIEKLEELIEAESNYRLSRRLEEVKEKQDEIQKRLDQIREYGYENPQMPDTFKKNYSQTGNQGFSIKVFTPISDSMPTCEVPDFFEPFAIPVDAYKKYDSLEEGLKIVHSEKFKQYRGFYQRAVRVGDTSFQDLRSVDELAGSDHKVKREYGDGDSWEDVRVQDEKNIKEKFQRDWNDMFFPLGVVCSSDFEYTLRERLKEAVLSDDPDIVCLYTGFLGDEAAKKFVIVYFLEILFDIVNSLSGSELRKLDRQFIASMIEVQEVIMDSKKDRSLTNVDRVYNNIIRKSMNDSGHYNFAFWFDVKPGDAHSMLSSKIPNKIITKIEQNVGDWASKNLDGKTDLMKKAFSDEIDYGSLDHSYPELGFGFLYSGTGDVKWEDKHGRTRYGHRLPCPRMCVQDPVDNFSKSDWSFFTEELDRWDYMSFKPYMDALFKEDWEANASPHIEEKERKKREEEKKKEEEEQSKRELRAGIACSKLRAKTEKKREVPDNWKPLMKQVYEEMVEEDLLEDDESGFESKKRALYEYTSELREELKEEFETRRPDDLDYLEVARDLVQDKEFVFGGSSKDDKQVRAKEFILEEFPECGERAAEEEGEEAADKAVRMLQTEGILNNSYQTQIERDEFERHISETFEFAEFESVEDEKEAEEDQGSSPESNTQNETEDIDESSEDDDGYRTVKITSEVPEFTGTDLETYGPFEEGEVEKLPVENAEILVNRGNAVEHEETGESEQSEGPGEEWRCSCGAINGPERSLCRNCTKEYDEKGALAH